MVKSSNPESKNELLDKIIQKTVGLQSDYVFKLAEKFGKTTENELRAEMSKKGSITLAN